MILSGWLTTHKVCSIVRVLTIPDWFISLLGFVFKKLPCSLVLSILNPKKGEELSTILQKKTLTRYDLESYSNNLLDYCVVLDLVPVLQGCTL